MQLDPSRLPAHVRLLLRCLAEPHQCSSLRDAEWDILIRAARSSRLLGVLAARIERCALGALPVAVERQLLAGRIEARFRRQKVLHLLHAFEAQLCPPAASTVLLKGAAYIVQDLALAEGRLPADVDVMVRRGALGQVEQALLDAGWEFEKTNAYDQHYYRAWSHELPPMKCAGQALELDLHHAILPPLGRLKPDTEALFAASIPVAGSPFRVLSPADQLLHAAAHLFQDSDCIGRLRDLVDFDALVREFAANDAAFWGVLGERARLHRLGRPLWYALSFGQAWLGTPVPASLLQERGFAPPTLARRTMQALVPLALFPVDPDSERSRASAAAAKLLEARAVWLRMPPHLVLYHAANKFVRGFRRAPAG